MRVITNSELTVRRRCQREHYYRYVLGRRPRQADSVAMEFGSRWHLGMEAWWRGEGVQAAYDAATRDCTDKYMAVSLQALLIGYDALWGEHAPDVVGVEVEFRTQIFGPEPLDAVLGGKIDVLLSDGICEHKCLAGDSRIFDHASGRYLTIRQMCSDGYAPVVTSIDERGAVVTAGALVPVEQQAQPTIRVTTKEGRAIVSSANHPYLTTRGWVAASDLTPTDWVATPAHQPSTHAGSALPDEAFRLAGYMIGDGCMSNMTFCKSDARVLDDVIYCSSVLGETPRSVKSSGRATALRFSKKGPVARLLRLLGVCGYAKDKRIPQIPMSDRQCAQIIAGLWSTDGCLDLFGGVKPRAIYTSVSERLCRDTQEMLQRLGISSSFKETSVAYNGKRRCVFTVNIVSRASKRRFATLVQTNFIPLKRSAVELDRFVSAIPTSNQGSDAARQPGNPHAEIWWDQVASVSTGEPEVLYDLSVPGPHNFVVEGIITHNTTGGDISPGSTYWQRLAIDSQISTYYLGARSLGVEPKRCVYDVVRRPELAPRKVPALDDEGVKIVLDKCGDRVATRDYRKWRETGDAKLGFVLQTRDESPDEMRARLLEAISAHPEQWFQRVDIVRMWSEMDEFEVELWQQADTMIRDIDADKHVRNADACRRGHGMCLYFGVCSGTATIDDSHQFEKIENVHQELEAETT